MKTFEDFNSEDSSNFTEDEQRQLMKDISKFYNDKIKEYRDQLFKEIEKHFIGKQITYKSEYRRHQSGDITKVSRYRQNAHDKPEAPWELWLWDSKYSHRDKNLEFLDDYLERIKKEKELKKVMKKNDPYGEEEWF